MKKAWNTVFHGPWTYWTGAIVLAILNMLVLYVRQTPWGVTTNIEEWARWIGSHLRLIPYQGFGLTDMLLSSGTYLNVGVILGAFWATLTASQARFRPIRDKKFFISALIGGIFMGYGARIAYGCNIGGLLNGIASGSVTGWVFGVGVMLGTWIGTKLLIRFLV